MGFTLSCGDIVSGCATQLQGETKEDVLRQAADHAKADHGMDQIDDATMEKVRESIRSS